MLLFIVIIIEFWDFSSPLLCYTVVSVLGIGIIVCWILGVFLGIVLTLTINVINHNSATGLLSDIMS